MSQLDNKLLGCHRQITVSDLCTSNSQCSTSQQCLSGVCKGVGGEGMILYAVSNIQVAQSKLMHLTGKVHETNGPFRNLKKFILAFSQHYRKEALINNNRGD